MKDKSVNALGWNEEKYFKIYKALCKNKKLNNPDTSKENKYWIYFKNYVIKWKNCLSKVLFKNSKLNNPDTSVKDKYWIDFKNYVIKWKNCLSEEQRENALHYFVNKRRQEETILASKNRSSSWWLSFLAVPIAIISLLVTTFPSLYDNESFEYDGTDAIIRVSDSDKAEKYYDLLLSIDHLIIEEDINCLRPYIIMGCIPLSTEQMELVQNAGLSIKNYDPKMQELRIRIFTSLQSFAFFYIFVVTIICFILYQHLPKKVFLYMCFYDDIITIFKEEKN